MLDKAEVLSVEAFLREADSQRFSKKQAIQTICSVWGMEKEKALKIFSQLFTDKWEHKKDTAAEMLIDPASSLLVLYSSCHRDFSKMASSLSTPVSYIRDLLGSVSQSSLTEGLRSLERNYSREMIDYAASVVVRNSLQSVKDEREVLTQSLSQDLATAKTVAWVILPVNSAYSKKIILEEEGKVFPVALKVNQSFHALKVFAEASNSPYFFWRGGKQEVFQRVDSKGNTQGCGEEKLFLSYLGANIPKEIRSKLYAFVDKTLSITSSKAFLGEDSGAIIPLTYLKF